MFLQSAVIFFGVLLARLKYGKTNAVLFTTYIGSSMSNLQAIIEAAFEKRAEITPKTVDAETRAAIEEVIEGLDSGKYRVAEKIAGEWVTHQWLKKRYCYLSALTITKSLTAQKQNITTKWH